MSAYHTPVLLDESVSALAIVPSGIYLDATFGGGGHSREILSRMDQNSRLLAFDRDSDALGNAPDDSRLILIHNNFRFIQNYVHYHGFEHVDGILADLGVSSHQFDTEERGFSFRFDALLDMRMNRSARITAADIVNSYAPERLMWVMSNYGEVENSKRVAQLICKYREEAAIKTTTDLNKALEPVLPKFAEHKYLAKVYQALRIEVNGEMKALEGFLDDTIKVLRPGGRLVVITYHSLEDRMVKNFMRSGTIDGVVEKDFYGNISSPFKAVTKKPLVPGEDEISGNTRARSAKLRVVEKK
ncbi:MAG: 16S rRNA (cytosine(1402)-N(4))-methyltransferase [Bacteroidetes bacterium GWF2_40_14]|nr:MAG: 16S rRNA (cytosine(1402)-N(4))-methyltransferase [Bacteroidetes bacterium GWF2_40_14]